MIAYAPFEEAPVVVQTRKVAMEPSGRPMKKKPKVPTMEGTECNYVVLVFLVGIMYLLITTAD